MHTFSVAVTYWPIWDLNETLLRRRMLGGVTTPFAYDIVSILSICTLNDTAVLWVEYIRENDSILAHIGVSKTSHSESSFYIIWQKSTSGSWKNLKQTGLFLERYAYFRFLCCLWLLYGSFRWMVWSSEVSLSIHLQPFTKYLRQTLVVM